jgi:ATP-dependent Clp protease ATP-binding subunit ClpA
MKELDMLIKTVADGLKSMAQGVEKLAGKVESISKSLDGSVKQKAPAKPKRKVSAKPTKKATRKTSKKQAADKSKPITAAETVLTVIKRSKKGVDTNTLMKKTGYDRKKVANIVYKLKKQNEIKATAKGVYTKA